MVLWKADFGPGPGSILLDNAIGEQSSLHTEDAGVRCGGKVMCQRCGGYVREWKYDTVDISRAHLLLTDLNNLY